MNNKCHSQNGKRRRLVALNLIVIMTLLGVVAVVQAATVTLYDGALGGTPDSQMLTYFGAGASIFDPPQATQSFANSATTLDTTPATIDKVGYFDLGNNVPVLSPTVGFRLTFDVQLLSENHVRPDRAGLSVILLGQDVRGIELGFWEDEIWAQSDNPLFTHAEGTTGFDPTSGMIRYHLDVQEDVYTLTANSVVVLSGSVRDYRAASGAFGFVYNTPNMVFIGDDTSSADAAFKVAYVAITQGIPQSVPTSVGLSRFSAESMAVCGLLASFVALLSATFTLHRRCG